MSRVSFQDLIAHNNITRIILDDCIELIEYFSKIFFVQYKIIHIFVYYILSICVL